MPISPDALARVYAAAYSSSGIHEGLRAFTPAPEARHHATLAVEHFVKLAHRVSDPAWIAGEPE